MTKNSLDVTCPLKLPCFFIPDECRIQLLDTRSTSSKFKINHCIQRLTIYSLMVSIAYAILPALVMDEWFPKELS